MSLFPVLIKETESTVREAYIVSNIALVTLTITMTKLSLKQCLSLCCVVVMDDVVMYTEYSLAVEEDDTAELELPVTPPQVHIVCTWLLQLINEHWSGHWLMVQNAPLRAVIVEQHMHCDQKKRPPKHVKITLWIENDSHYFFPIMKGHLFAMFLWNFTTTSLSIAEIFFYKKVVENCHRQRC